MFEERQESSRLHTGFVAVPALAGGLLLLLLIEAVPYHIDELRQVLTYHGSVGFIIESAISAQQPPLDYLINAGLMRLIGVGDFQQRLGPALFAIGSLFLVGSMARDSGLRLGASVSVIVLSVSPIFISTSAYARPYALPLFLMLLILVALGRWVELGNRGWLAVATVAGLLLPLSRSGEPPIFLGVTALALLAVAFARSAERTRALWGSAVVSICLVVSAAPMVVLLGRNTPGLAGGQSGSALAENVRLLLQTPERLGEIFPAWPVLVLLAACAFALRDSRSRMKRWWAWWVLLAVPIIFIIALRLFTTNQPSYASRYAFTFIPPIALAAGSVAEAVSKRLSRGPWNLKRTFTGAIAAVAIVVLSSAWFVGVKRDVVHSAATDWEHISEVLMRTLPPDAIVVYDQVVPFGGYRAFFYGQPRYYRWDRSIPSVELIARQPEVVPSTGEVAVLLRGADFPLEGWVRFEDGHFTVYRSTDSLTGRVGATEAMLDFSRAMPETTGLAMAAAAASLMYSEGETQSALATVAWILDNAEDREQAVKELRELGMSELVESA